MICRLLALVALFIPASSFAQEPYSKSPLEAYLQPSVANEIALARSAAPPSISDNATILVFGRQGYETAGGGNNGFVCLVARGWGNKFAHPEFWNPKVRSPICYNRASASSVLPSYLERSRWVIAGLTKDEMLARTRQGVESGQFTAPAIGSMCYMMSPHGYLDDSAAGPWQPHLMYFVPRTAAAEWGANLPGSPMIGDTDEIEPVSVFLAPVPVWSDGSPGRRGASS
jgi:hypothetical protein